MTSELCETCDNNVDNCKCVDCRSCGEKMEISSGYQGRCDACEDRQMVQGIR